MAFSSSVRWLFDSLACNVLSIAAHTVTASRRATWEFGMIRIARNLTVLGLVAIAAIICFAVDQAFATPPICTACNIPRPAPGPIAGVGLPALDRSACISASADDANSLAATEAPH